MKKLNLPFSHIAKARQHTQAASGAFDFEITLQKKQPIKFFGLIVFNEGPEHNQQIVSDLSQRIEQTIRQQNHLLANDFVNVSPEDFFEQVLQKINAVLTNFLHDVPSKLPLQSWGMLLGAVAPSDKDDRLEFHVSRFGEISGWLLNKAQLQTRKLISIFDTPDNLPKNQLPHKFFKNILSSYLPTSDLLFFCTPNVLNYVSLTELKNVLLTLSPAAAVKHIENQVEFTSPNEHLVAAITLPLSPYKIKPQDSTAPSKRNAQSSMTSLLETTAKTEQILGNQGSLSLEGIKSLAANLPEKLGKMLPKREVRRTKYQAPQQKSSTKLRILQIFNRPQQSRQSPIELMSRTESLSYTRSFMEKVLEIIPSFVKGDLARTLLKKPALYLIVLALGLGFHFYSGWKDTKQEEALIVQAADERLSMVEENINRIDSHLIVGRESDAVAVLNETKELIATLSSFPTTAARAEELSSALEERMKKLRKETTVQESNTVLADLAALIPMPKGIVRFEDTLYVIGKEPNKLLQLSTSSNAAPKILEIETELTSWTSAGIPDKNTVMLLSGTSQTRIDIPSLTASTKNSNSSSELKGFALYNDRIYTLAQSENDIFKSSQGPNTLNFTRWLNEEIQLADAVDLAIDSTIYVLKPQSVLQLHKGRTANPGVTLEAVTPPLQNATRIWTNENSRRLYILSQNRFYIFEKNGKFVKQFALEDGSSFNDFAIDEENGAAYLLTGENLYKVNL